MNKTGKTLTIFLIVFVVILLCLTAISVFFFVKEVELRKTAENSLEQQRVVESKLQGDLKESKKKIFVLEEKSKEAEERIEDLMKEIELEKGVSEELKKENKDLMTNLETEKQEKEELSKQLSSDLEASEQKISDLQGKIDALKAENQKVVEERQQLQAKYEDIQKQLDQASKPAEPAVTTPAPEPASASPAVPAAQQTQQKMEVPLDKIVVSPSSGKDGKVISVDQETDFVIVSLGEKDKIQKGSVLSIYRGSDYLGDVTVSRVLPEMSAADFVAPLTSQKVMKDDRVVAKK